MSLVKVKEKFQVTLPAAIRQKAGVDVGDLLEATVQGKRITFTPKVAVDRAFVEQRLAEGLEDVKKGRVSLIPRQGFCSGRRSARESPGSTPWCWRQHPQEH